MKESSSSPKKQYRISLYIFLAVLALFLGLNIALILPYLIAVLMGALLMVLARPPFTYLRRKGLSPKLAALVVVLAILILVVGPLAGFITIAIQEAVAVGQWLAQKDLFSIDTIVEKVSSIGPVMDTLGGKAKIESQIRTGIQESGKAATGMLLALLGKFPDIFLQVVLALVTCFFLLVDGKSFLEWLRTRVPMPREVQKAISNSFRDTSLSVVWSTIAAAATQAVLMFVSFLAIGVPGAFLAAGATFIFAWIPLVGSTPVWVIAVIYLFLKSSLAKAIIMLIAGIITGVADNIVRPVVLKGRSNMHPLVSLLAVFGGIQIFGIFGVFWGPILVGSLTALLEIWPTIGRQFGILPEE